MGQANSACYTSDDATPPTPTKHQPFNFTIQKKPPHLSFPYDFHPPFQTLPNWPIPLPPPVQSPALARPTRRTSSGDWSLTRATSSVTLNRRTWWLTDRDTWSKWGSPTPKEAWWTQPQPLSLPEPFHQHRKPEIGSRVRIEPEFHRDRISMKAMEVNSRQRIGDLLLHNPQ
jgi:hypothetical protein